MLTTYCICSFITSLATYLYAKRVTTSDTSVILVVSILTGIVWPVAILLKSIDVIMERTKKKRNHNEIMGQKSTPTGSVQPPR